jgi:hypothetical protein
MAISFGSPISGEEGNFRKTGITPVILIINEADHSLKKIRFVYSF